MNTEEIRARVFTVLAEKGIGQKDFAEKLGTTDKTVSAWKTGRVDSFASMKWLPKIAEVLGTTVEYLVSGEKKSPPPLRRARTSWIVTPSWRHSLAGTWI